MNAVRLTGVILAVASLGFIMPTALSADAPLALYALAALIGSWLDTAGLPEEREAGRELMRGLDANRVAAGERPLVPPELEGVTW